MPAGHSNFMNPSKFGRNGAMGVKAGERKSLIGSECIGTGLYVFVEA
jgi:hypothetical protein